MKNTSSFLAGAIVVVAVVAAVALVSGQGGTTKAKKLRPCDNDSTVGDCTIAVTIETCGFLNLSHCTTVIDDVVLIHKGKKPTVWWKIADSTYKFATDSNGKNIGIVVSNGGDEFKDCEKVNDQTYSCKSHHNNFGVFKYAVNVSGLDSLDPWVVNE